MNPLQGSQLQRKQPCQLMFLGKLQYDPQETALSLSNMNLLYFWQSTLAAQQLGDNSRSWDIALKFWIPGVGTAVSTAMKRSHSKNRVLPSFQRVSVLC